MKKIQNRFFLQILMPIVLIYVVIVVFGLIFVNRSYEQGAVLEKEYDLANISRAANDWLIARISELLQLSRIPLMQSADHDSVRLYLKEWRMRLSFIYKELYFVAPDGNYWNTSLESGHFSSSSLLDRFNQDVPRYFYIGPVYGEPAFSRTILVSVPVYKQERMIGILAGVIPLETIRRMLGFFSFAEFESYMLVDQFGVILVHSQSNLAGRAEKEIYGREFTTTSTFLDRIVFVDMLRTTWKLVGFQTRTALLKAMNRINRLVILFFLMVISLLVIVSYATTSYIVRPILKLTQGVEKIMVGDFRQQIKIKTNDEMKTLADSFNKLCERMARIRTDDRFLFLGHISARMAHEIRKPLHIIQLATQAMESKQRFNQKHITFIHQAIENADRFIKEILNIAKPEMMNFKKQSLSRLWEKVLPPYSLLAENLGIRLEYREEGEIPPFYFDVTRMEEVFSNLVNNALEAVTQFALQDKIREKKVFIRLKYQHSRGVMFTIEDTGGGFNQELSGRFFDPYFTTKDEGTGLGLSISYRILTAHGAKINLKNTEQGHGLVEVLFPL